MVSPEVDREGLMPTMRFLVRTGVTEASILNCVKVPTERESTVVL